jgi:hypothetical protein
MMAEITAAAQAFVMTLRWAGARDVQAGFGRVLRALSNTCPRIAPHAGAPIKEMRARAVGQVLDKSRRIFFGGLPREIITA